MDSRWQHLTPDSESGTPLYLQLASRLASLIQAGRWNAGEALPSERNLCEGVGVSRVTARKAIALLVERGLIRRVRGAGNFIAPRVNDRLSRLAGCSEMLEQRGFTPNSVWLERALRAASRDESATLGLSAGALVASLRRLRCANGVVMSLEHSALPVAVVPEPLHVGGSLYRFLEARGESVVRASQRFRAVNASVEIAGMLGVTPRSALLVITRIGFTAKQRAIEVTDTYCRNEHYEFVAELHRDTTPETRFTHAGNERAGQQQEASPQQAIRTYT